MEIDDLIAKNLANIVAAKKTNPSALAKAAGLGHTAVRDIIQRNVNSPTYATLLKIAKELGVDVTEITVGPSAAPLSPEQREMLDLLSKISKQEREFLLKSARGLVDRSHEASK